MLTLLISLIIAAGASYASITNGLSLGATLSIGMAGFFVSMFLIGFIIRKKITKTQSQLQELMAKGQSRINLKVQKFQSKPGGNPTQMQRELEGEQKIMLKKALEFLPQLEPYKKWNLLMGRQIDTMRFQFLYQLKEFKQADALLSSKSPFSGPLYTEPMMVAMQMARQYENKQFDAAEKTYKKRVKWFRGERGTILYGLMSWIHMKNGDAEKARQVLLKGKETTGNQVLTRNWEHLSNRNEKKFSNAGLGEEWFGLYLEKPVAPKQKRMRGNAQGGGRF